MEVEISQEAKDNLLGIFHYHVEYDSNFACKFQQDITQFFMVHLKDFPNMGVIHNTQTGVRKVVFKDYNIYYHTTEEIITILHILHARLNLNELLRD